MKKMLRIALYALVPMLAAGCTALQPVKQAPLNTFALEADVARKASAPPRDAPVLMVGLARARSGFDSPRMVYVRKLHELEYFAQNQWVDTPSRMLTPLLLQTLDAGGAFRAVVTPQSGANANLRLETEIVRLQQEFLSEPSTVRFTLRVQLIDVAAKQVLAGREFDVTETAPSDDPYGGVVAANRALQRVLGEVADFCAARGKTPGP